VLRDPIYVRDGNVYTSAGVTAGIDLALALVEEDPGAEVAMPDGNGLLGFDPSERAGRGAERPAR
jgi:transcriptional regulator GlxA family with amidase domain